MTDYLGLNAFWIAAFYGNVTIMKALMDHGIEDIYC